MTEKYDDYIRFAVADKPLSADWEVMIKELKDNNIDYHLKEYIQRDGTVEVNLFMSEKNADHLAVLLEIYDL